MLTSRVEAPVDVELSVSGHVSRRDRERVVEKIWTLLEGHDAHVLHTRIRLDHVDDPARERPATARVSVDVNGRPLRAHVSATTMEEAIDLLKDRLRDRLDHSAAHLRALRRRGASSPEGEWRHGDFRRPRPDHFPRDPEQREVVRHKTYTTTAATVDEAIYDLESMDYDFFLFTEAETGQEAVVDRIEGGEYRLQYLNGPVDAPDPGSFATAVQVIEPGAPALTVEESRAALDDGREPFLFFADPVSDRGRVMYRRYDGHYGLITPREQAG